MFGYVKPFKPELRVKELDAYKAIYCGLCGQLGKSYGHAFRFILSYDFTFLCLLEYAVSDKTPAVSRRRCFVNPLKKLPVCESGPPLLFGAHVAVIMLYYKLRDNLADNGLLKKIGYALLFPFGHLAFRKAKKACPRVAELMRDCINRQRELEAGRSPSVDQACEPTALAMAGICAELSQDAGQKRVLERLGYLIGRYCYLCDALDDLEQDLKSGNYNPFVLRYSLRRGDSGGISAVHQGAKDSLLMTIGEAAKTGALLETDKLRPIIDNVLYLGLRASVEEILQKKEKST